MHVLATLRRIAPLALVGLTLSLSGCAAQGAEDDELQSADEEAIGTTSDAITGSRTVGTTLRTTTALNLRTGAGTSNRIIVTMPGGATVRVLRAQPVSGWYEISYSTHRGWASGAYLVDAGGGGGGGGSAPQRRILGPAVRSHVQGFANSACAAVGCPYEVGTRVGHDPSADRALDFMMSRYGTVAGGGERTRGDNLAARAVNDRTYKVMYAIWRQRINTRDGRGWRGMANRGSNTQNHYDHVHVSFKP